MQLDMNAAVVDTTILPVLFIYVIGAKLAIYLAIFLDISVVMCVAVTSTAGRIKQLRIRQGEYPCTTSNYDV